MPTPCGGGGWKKTWDRSSPLPGLPVVSSISSQKGFVATGPSVAQRPGVTTPYETNLPGVFAVGDVRSGSVKRVASAVGEGSVVVQAVHQYLAGTGNGV